MRAYARAMSEGALGGIRVVELGHGTAGPVAGMHLADHGADVVMVEPPGGRPGRDEPGFAVWGRGKRSVTGDPGPWLAGADVIVLGGGAGLDLDALAAEHPAAVVLHLPPDPVPTESASLLSAALGISLRQASFEDVPVDPVLPFVLTIQGTWGAACAVAALVERAASGAGQVVTVDGGHAAALASAGGFVVDPETPRRPRVGGAGGGAPMYRVYECADGEWLFLAALTPNFYVRGFEAIGASHLLDDPRLEGRWGRMLKPENVAWTIEQLQAIFATRPRDEWLRILHDADCPAGPVLDRDDWLDHPQVDAIGMRVTVDDPERGRVVMPGVPAVLTATPGRVRGPAPRAGAHDGDEPWPRRPAEPIVPAAADGNGPLAGVRVLDLGAIIAGPYAGSLLGELGAEVVKVEPTGGESFRGAGALPYNKGQRGLAIDLRDERGRAAFGRLAARADVVIDNYRPGVLGRLRLTHDDLRGDQPGLISVSITGFGEGGPLGDEPGFDPVLQAMSGMMRAQGGDDSPVYTTVPVNDVATAASTALAACLALFARTRSGEGQRVWTSLAGTATALQAAETVRYAGRPPALVGGRDFPGPGPVDRFHPVADGWIRVHAEDLPFDPAELAGLDRSAAVTRLAEAGVPAAPARHPEEVAVDPAVLDAERMHVVDLEGHPPRTPGRLARFGRTPRRGVLLPPALGEHTPVVLAEAGLDPTEIDGLLAAGVVAGSPAPVSP